MPYIDLAAGMRVQRVARFSPKANFILWKVESGCEDTEWTLAGQDSKCPTLAAFWVSQLVEMSTFESKSSGDVRRLETE